MQYAHSLVDFETNKEKSHVSRKGQAKIAEMLCREGADTCFRFETTGTPSLLGTNMYVVQCLP